MIEPLLNMAGMCKSIQSFLPRPLAYAGHEPYLPREVKLKRVPHHQIAEDIKFGLQININKPGDLSHEVRNHQTLITKLALKQPTPTIVFCPARAMEHEGREIRLLNHEVGAQANGPVACR